MADDSPRGRRKRQRREERWRHDDGYREGEPLLQIGGTPVRRDDSGRMVQVSPLPAGGQVALMKTP